jgi:hypothetical protein
VTYDLYCTEVWLNVDSTYIVRFYPSILRSWGKDKSVSHARACRRRQRGLVRVSTLLHYGECGLETEMALPVSWFCAYRTAREQVPPKSFLPKNPARNVQRLGFGGATTRLLVLLLSNIIGSFFFLVARTEPVILRVENRERAGASEALSAWESCSGCAAIRFWESDYAITHSSSQQHHLLILLPGDTDDTVILSLHQLRSTTSSNLLVLPWVVQVRMEPPMSSAWDPPLGTP